MSTYSNDLALYIDGQWRSGEGRRVEPVINPCTGEAIGELPHASEADVADALSAASRGFRQWREVPAIERSRLMLRAVALIQARVEAIASLVSAEQGKPLAEARGEVLRAADMIQFCAEEARRLYGRVIPAREPHLRQSVLLEPVGPIAGFTPWNFPAISPARKIGGALAAGCSLVLKPSEEVPATAVALVRAFEDAGLPAGVLNLLFGDPAGISSQLIASPVIRKVVLTGSVPVGKILAVQAAQHMKPCTMELGGHAPVVVCADVDPRKTAAACAAAKFRNAGQICISPTRFYVSRGLYADFCEAFADAANAIRVGDVARPEVQMGPLINARRREAIESLVADAVQRGARLLAGGRRVGERGFFYAPTVLADLPDDARVLHEEPFGPVALIRPFDYVEDAIAEANALPFGLAAYAFTDSARWSHRLASGLEAGVVGLNRFGISEPETPFGGVKDSGYGREGGIEGLESYVSVKFVSHSA